MSQIYELDIPDTPPSLNAASLGSRGAHMKFHRVKKQWQGYLLITFLETKLPKGLFTVHATALLRFPQRRKRDEGNFRFMLEKALGDALQINGHLEDDTPDQFTFGKLTFEEERGTPRTLVRLSITTEPGGPDEVAE
jgi:hypothetical protein